MAITQAICNSYKLEALQGIHSTAHTYKIALFTSSAVLSKLTTAYSTVEEITGGGYVAGGMNLSGCTANVDGDVAYLDFADAQWSTATITARGALIYNSNVGNKAVCVIDFGSDYACANGAFTVQFPAPAALTAIVRIT